MGATKELIVCIGMPGSGKTTYCSKVLGKYGRISQDDQGKEQHYQLFLRLVNSGHVPLIVIDRCNQNREQRERYTKVARDLGYRIKFLVFKTDKELCERRIYRRDNHATIDPRKANVRAILNRFSTEYTEPKADEYDEISYIHTPYRAEIKDISHLKGRFMVIGDLHGVFTELRDAVESENPDHIVVLGDLCDRGPDYTKLLKYLVDKGAHMVEGNHERRLMRYLMGAQVKTAHGFQTTLEQINEMEKSELGAKDALKNFLIHLPTVVKMPGKRLAVHAGFDTTKTLENQAYATCIYSREVDGKPWYAHEFCSDLRNYKIFFGHQVHKYFNVRDNVYALDGGAVFGGKLRYAIFDSNSDKEEFYELKCQEYYKDSIESGETVSPKLPSTLERKEALVKEGYLSKSELNTLVLYNYTDKCTYDKHWNLDTVASRGTIYNRDTGEIVARAFDKFFNLNEHPSTQLDNLPNLPFITMEKVDGSLGILFKDGDKWRVSTRGSFYSEQAERATQMLSKYDLSKWPAHLTPLVEIVYPENRIVVDYGKKEELVLLAARNIKTGEYANVDTLKFHGFRTGMRLPKYYGNSLNELIEFAKTVTFQTEGWVIQYANGLMVKIKGDDYMRIAKIKSHLTPLSVWEAMMARRIKQYLWEIPEEIREEAEDIYDRLDRQLAELNELASECLDSACRQKDQKSKAEIVTKYPKCVRAYVFDVLRTKQPKQEYLIKHLRPTGNTYVDMRELLA